MVSAVGPEQCRIGRVFALYETDPDSILAILYGTPKLPGVISELKAKYSPWVLSGMAQNTLQIKFYTRQIL